MNKLPFLSVIFLLAVACQNNTDSSTSRAEDHDTTHRSFSSVSESYGSIKSDSLLLPSEIRQVINARDFTELRSADDEGGDCQYRTRLLAASNDTLIVKKYNCGEYGFGTYLFLKNTDSLKLVAAYTIAWLPGEKESVYVDSLQIVKFKKSAAEITEGQKVIKNWIELKLDAPRNKTEYLYGTHAIRKYQILNKKYRTL